MSLYVELVLRWKEPKKSNFPKMGSGYDLTSIAKLLNGELIGSPPLSPINILLIDSRKMVSPENALFFAIVGEQHDGHKYISQLVKRGFTNFVVSKKQELPEGCCQLLVDDTLDSFQRLAKAHRKKFNYPVVGITGSNGKTIVKEWLFQLLQPDLGIVRSPKSYNSQIGVPLSVWKMGDNHEIALIEAGISMVGEMALLQEIIDPTDVIITNIHEAHDENFDNR
ncbi:MAG: hypothetical protein JKY42_02405 [Flavobacteriales bacterium]|nr:hypothetical protein [Flavobacteriales bacterium]